MTSSVFVAVIAAAVLHAVWNAIAKGGNDKHLSMTAVVVGHVPIALVVLPFVPAPAPESWPFIAAGMCMHVGYQLALLTAYRIGDLTQVYPIARGVAPLIVAGVSIVFLGEVLAPMELLAILCIVIGILSLSLVRQADGAHNAKASAFALLTGCFIASYSLIDGHGARLAGTALGYYGWMTIGNAIVFVAYIAVTRPSVIKALRTEARTTMVVGGGGSFLAYSIVIWSFMQAPIALVTALRETSIVFALLIGVGVLNEKLSLRKVFSTFVTLLGAALLRLSKT